MAQQQMTSSQKALMLELKSLQEEPVEGFRITLVDESDLYNWEVAIFGPPNTLYEGGYFKVPSPPLRLPPAEAAVLGCFPGREWERGGAEGAPHLGSPLPPSVEAGRPRLLTRCLFFVMGAGAGGQPAPGNRKASVARVVATGGGGGRSLFCFPRRGFTERKVVCPPTASHQNHLCAGWNYPRGQSDLHLWDWTFFGGGGGGRRVGEGYRAVIPEAAY